MGETLTLLNPEFETILKGGSPDFESGGKGAVVPLRVRSDRTLQVWSQLIGLDDAGVQRILALESDRTLKAALYGKDSAGNIDPLRTNDDQQLQVEVVNDWLTVDPVLVPSTEGILWSPGSASAERYEFSVLVVNIDGANDVTVSLGIDLAAGGTLAAQEYFMRSEVIPAPGTSGWRGPFIMGGDDDVRGIAGVADDAAAHFRARQLA